MSTIRFATILLLLTALTMIVSSSGHADPDSASPRTRLLADFGWKFYLGDAAGAEAIGFNDRAWRTVDLPHDWSIEGPYSEQASTSGRGGYLPTGIGWYRRQLEAPKSWRNKKVLIEFDGVYENSDVWINGHLLGHRPFGYIGFEYDLTPYLSFGKSNLIAVRVDNSQQPNSRWYSGSGITRNVWMTIASPLRIAHWGTYITTPSVSTASASVDIRTEIRNDLQKSQSIKLVSRLIGPYGTAVATDEKDASAVVGAATVFDQTITVPNPRLWALDSPSIYRVVSQVKIGDKVVDQAETPFGIRTIDYDVDKGFSLNGKSIKMHGMCLHHDGGSVGAAVPIGVWERRLKLLKAMGCNAIRCSHNPPAPEFLDLCDRLGFLVMDESFDEWTWPKVPHGYAQYFKEWSQLDLTDMLRRDRNHPSIVLWSVGNEIGEQTDPNGAAIVKPLVETCHHEDPTRPVTAACDNVFTDHGGATLDFLNALDIVGYNYVDRWGSRRETYYSDDRRQFPQRKFVGTEENTVYSQRGDYRFAPMGSDQLTRPNYESAMIRTEGLLRFDELNSYVIGEFFWTGIDYLGESRWPNKLATSGALDTCGFPKDSFYFFQSRWTTQPMVHLLPHWTWPGREGQVIPVICYTNCSTVELFVNGKSFGAKSIEFPRQGTAGGWNSYATPPVAGTTSDLHLEWDVPYEPGVLRAVGYRDGKQVSTTEVHTAGPPASIKLTCNRDTMDADGRDVAHIVASVVDAQGNMAPTADNAISFQITGPGALIGVDSGDPASHEDYKAATRKAYNGLCLAIVQSAFQPGMIHVTATANGLQSSTVEAEVVKPENEVATLP